MSRIFLARSLENYKELLSCIDKVSSKEELNKIGNQLYLVEDVLDSNKYLIQAINNVSKPIELRSQIIDEIFSAKVDKTVLELLKIISSKEWSKRSDSISALEKSGTYSLLKSLSQTELKKVENDISNFYSLLESNSDIEKVLTNQIVSFENRKTWLADLLKDKFDSTAVSIIVGTLKRVNPIKKLLSVLNEIADFRGAKFVEITSSSELTEKQKTEFLSIIKKDFGTDALLAQKIDPNIIGGAVIKVGDEIIDGSFKSRLTKLTGSI